VVPPTLWVLVRKKGKIRKTKKEIKNKEK